MPEMVAYPIIIGVAIVLHLIWSVGVLIDPSAINATGLRTMLLIVSSPGAAALIFGGAALLALLGLLAHRRLLRILLFLPQQAVLWVSVAGAVNAMILGQFADGVQRAHWFLVVDQMAVVLITIGHTLALLVMAERGRGVG